MREVTASRNSQRQSGDATQGGRGDLNNNSKGAIPLIATTLSCYANTDLPLRPGLLGSKSPFWEGAVLDEESLPPPSYGAGTVHQFGVEIISGLSG